MADGGYDVADYRAIDPAFGTLDGGRGAHRARRSTSASGRSSTSSPTTSPTATPGSRRPSPPVPARRSASGSGSGPAAAPDGDEPPTGWPSEFKGARPGRRTTNPDGTPGDWYLHLFTAEQPDLNWDHPDVRAEHEAILRFWFDRGAAGVRIDSAALLVKDPALPEVPADPGPGAHPTHDRDELHDIYRGWRAVADALSRRRASSSARSGSRTPSGSPATSGPDELHTAFNFDFMARPWDAASLRESIDATLAAHAPGRRAGDLGAVEPRRHPARDPVRPAGLVVRLRPQAVRDPDATSQLGRRRARAAALLTAALPGSLYVYQGDELGLDEVDVAGDRDPGPDARPVRRRSTPAATAAASRCRGAGRRAPFGFSPADADRVAVAQPARPLGEPDRRGAGSRSSIDAQPLPWRRCGSGDPSPASGDGPFDVARRPSPASSPSPRPDFVCITNLSGAAAAAAAPSGGRCSPAPTPPTATFRPTRPPGCGRIADAPSDPARRVPDDEAERRADAGRPGPTGGPGTRSKPLPIA